AAPAQPERELLLGGDLVVEVGAVATPAPGAAPVRPAAPAGDVPAALWALLTLAVTPYGCPPAGS
ncbi:hypothetical protein, partial [Streptosporangium sandarakinum]